MRRVVAPLAFGLTAIVSLLIAAGSQAVVVDMKALGQPSVQYNPSDQTGYFGVALVPGTYSLLSKANIPVVKSTTPSTACPSPDPWLAPDLGPLPSSGLCWHGGSVINANETLALTWDPGRAYWATTRNYVERFLRDVADGSNTLSSPYAVTTQYRDSTAGRAFNRSVYAGGCIDYGATGGSACKLASTDASGPGHDYHDLNQCPNGSTGGPVTDADIRCEVMNMVAQTSLDDPGHVQPGYKLTVVLLMPPGVQVCLDSGHALCSATGVSPAQTPQFCSYHSHVTIHPSSGAAIDLPYVVQPWTAHTACDEPGLAANQNPAIDAGTRLVSPLSQGQIAAAVNPNLNGWFATSQGSEINDNTCSPGGSPADRVTVGSSAQNPYYLQPEFNNAGVLGSDPNAPACALGVALAPTFVVPSPIDQGNVVAFDGSVTVSTLMVPKNNYQWNFGDGVTSLGPSVVHVYARGGRYTVTLHVTDRGGNQSTISQPIEVLGADGLPVPPAPPAATALHARLQLLPQGLRTMLRVGVAARVSSNEVADGIATMSISTRDADRAQIRHRRGANVVIARGTVSQLRTGTVALTLRLSPATAAKLRRLRHVSLTVRISLVAADHHHLTIVAAGRY